MGESVYKCSSVNMRNCVDKLVKWIQHAQEIEMIMKNAELTKWFYLTDERSGWYFIIDGEECKLGEALETLLDRETEKSESRQGNDGIKNLTKDRVTLLETANNAYSNMQFGLMLSSLMEFQKLKVNE